MALPSNFQTEIRSNTASDTSDENSSFLVLFKNSSQLIYFLFKPIQVNENVYKQMLQSEN